MVYINSVQETWNVKNDPPENNINKIFSPYHTPYHKLLRMCSKCSKNGEIIRTEKNSGFDRDALKSN